MSSILEILDIEELKIRKNNLLYQLERIDNELKKRENNKNVKGKLDENVSCDHVSCDHVPPEKDLQKPDEVFYKLNQLAASPVASHLKQALPGPAEKPKIMKIKIKKKE
jgi:hypothetical protein